MTNILTISDTHSNSELLKRVLDNEKDVDVIFHLGDNYEDIEEFNGKTDGKLVYRVPGIYHPGYLSGKLPKYLNVDIEGVNFLLIHKVEESYGKSCDFVLFGHTHCRSYYKNEIHYLNPGHLKSFRDKGNAPSYAVMDVDKTKIGINFKDISGQLLQSLEINR